MTQVLRGVCVGLLMVQLGCGHRVVDAGPSLVREIRIADAVTPALMRVSLGEEIQWINARSASVRIGFLTMRLLDELACEKGVKTLFGQVNDLITIPAGESISLCFGRVGELKYNVWFEPENPRGRISPTATVRIEGRG
jgi:hypothetical protein